MLDAIHLLTLFLVSIMQAVRQAAASSSGTGSDDDSDVRMLEAVLEVRACDS